MTKPRTLPLLLIGACLAVVLFNGAAQGREYNQRPFLAPEHQAKIQKTIARGRRMQGEGKESAGVLKPGQDVVNAGCGSLRVGNVDTSGARPGQRVPRENIIVARDIINTTFGCGR